MRRIVFRFDASPVIGMGHWYRCLALHDEIADTYKQPVEFITNRLAPELKNELHRQNIKFHEVDHVQQSSELVPFLGKDSLLVLDLMSTTDDFVLSLRKECKILSIGGSGTGKDHVNVRIDGMIARPGYTDGFEGERLFLGPEYIILRNHFEDVLQIPIRKEISNILVALGADSAGKGFEIAKILTGLFSAISITLMIGPLTRIIKTERASIRICQNIDNPKSIMESCDIGISSGGMTSFELFRLGKPQIFLPQVPLQEVVSRSFEESGLGFVIMQREQEDIGGLSIALARIIDSYKSIDLRKKIANSASMLVDGQGVKRVARIIYEEILT